EGQRALEPLRIDFTYPLTLARRQHDGALRRAQLHLLSDWELTCQLELTVARFGHSPPAIQRRKSDLSGIHHRHGARPDACCLRRSWGGRRFIFLDFAPISAKAGEPDPA